VAGLWRSARRRAAAFTSSELAVRGGRIGAARSSAPIRLGAATGEPVVVSLTLLKLWNGGERSTLDTVSRSALRPAGSERCACGPPYPAGHGRGTVAALHQGGVTWRERLAEPVHLGERDRVAEQLVSRSDHYLARIRTDRDHIHRLTESAGKAAPLPDGVAGE